MSRHLLGVLEPSVVLQVNCDPGGPPGNTSLFGDRQNSIHGGFANAELKGNTLF
jgi:hypothetical protein